MGCCTSREASAAAPGLHPAAPNHASQSRQALAHSSPAQPSSITSHISRTQARPNAPLKPINPTQRSTLPATLASPTTTHPPNAGANGGSTPRHHRPHLVPLTDSTSSQWTLRRLERERNDWWDTRITGQPEIWNAIRIIVQLQQKGELQEAQAMLDAAGCTCPQGDIWKGVFDEHGEWYRVPEWIIIEPNGLVDEEAAPELEEETEGMEQGTQEGIWKGKGKAEGIPFQIRCRLSSNQQDVVVSICEGEHVASLVRKLKECTGMKDTTRIRIAFGGKFYDEHKSLESNPYWKREDVVNVMVFEQ